MFPLERLEQDKQRRILGIYAQSGIQRADYENRGVDDTNAAIYVDTPEAFDTTLTTCICTMPWHNGSTDEVACSDGSPDSNTNGKNAYKIQGIETCIGAYEVLGNEVWIL